MRPKDRDADKQEKNAIRRVATGVHCIAPGGDLLPIGRVGSIAGPDSSCPSRLYRRLFLDGLAALFVTGDMSFFGNLAGLADRRAFLAYLAQWRKREWVVYAKRPFAGPEQVLAYLDYRANGRSKLMRLPQGEFMAGSSCTSCLKAFIASGTTAFSPMVIAPKMLRAAGCRPGRQQAFPAGQPIRSAARAVVDA